MSKIDDKQRGRVYEVYELVGDQIIKYVSLTGEDYVPHSVRDVSVKKPCKSGE